MPRQNIIIAVVVILLSVVCYSRTSIQEQILHYTLQKIGRSALEPAEPESLLDGAFGGMLQQMPDFPYSAYLAPEEEASYEEEIQGRLAGIGVTILGSDGSDPPRLWFIPMHAGPAEEASMRFGDRIAAADGEDFAGLNIGQISKRLRGDPDTEITLTVIGRESLLDDSSRPAAEKEEAALRTVTIKRRLLQQDIVSGDHRNEAGEWDYTLSGDPKTGYIKIDQFTDSTGPDFIKAIESLDGKIDRLILDLRGNPGGFLPAAIAVSEPFLQKGDPIVTTRHRDGSVKGEYKAGDGKKYDWPIAVLIDSGSASASEIVSAALSDHHRAVLFGHRSFGKGTVQELFPLPCGMGMLRLTIASFWRPSGEPIHHRHDMTDDDIWGVQPDYPVEMTDQQISEAMLYQGIRSTAEYTAEKEQLDRLAEICLESLHEFSDDDEEADEEDSEEETADASNTPEPGQEAERPSANNNPPDNNPPGFDPVLEKAREILRTPEPSASGPSVNQTDPPPR